MTDEELKALVASLAVSQKQTDEQIKQTHEELKASMEALALSQKQTDEQMKKTDEQMKKNDEQMKKTDEKLERMGIYLGNVTRNQGDVAEEFFFNSLVNETRLGSIYFDNIMKNMQNYRGNLQEEYDLFLTNGDTIAIVEVKYKAHTNDLKKLDRKMGNFKLLFPIYKDYKLYGALASFYINDDTKKEALERGYFVLQRSGDLIHTECPISQLKIL
jgi:hypothetical protein